MILPSFTFVSTANAVVLRGATPVFVDLDPVTLTIDPREVEAAVTPKTKRQSQLVRYPGIAADMDPLRDIANNHGLVLLEDAARHFDAEALPGPALREPGRPCGDQFS